MHFVGASKKGLHRSNRRDVLTDNRRAIISKSEIDVSMSRSDCGSMGEIHVAFADFDGGKVFAP
ncbi:hypothetical protein G6M16_016090 [Agrobacterium tumefaciens]|uniref:hypothetical protein n=1 Tax=Agrobacterium pusense TaxID=648995 RepID=UPI0015720F76|nr:hypothetical protein G6M16_016090 [Agrobacterium tumefaciens]